MAGRPSDVLSAEQETSETERLRRELDRQRARFRALIADMSHELRTPVNAILGFAEIMGSEAIAPIDRGKNREYSRHIHTAGTHLLNLLNDFRDLAKAETGELALNETEFDLARTIANAVGAVELSARQANLSLEIGDLAPAVLYADEVKLTQILLNLLTNAIKFTPERGAVSVSERLTREGACVIEVADTGIGIPRSQIPKAFVPFAQIQAAPNGADRGTGLGLALTKHLVERHEGRIVLHSKVGSGTTARVTLPPSRVRPPAAKELSRAAG